jgi:hypothetical protein
VKIIRLENGAVFFGHIPGPTFQDVALMETEFRELYRLVPDIRAVPGAATMGAISRNAPTMSFPLTQIFINQYGAAAAEGGIVELKLRLLADKVPALQAYTHQQRLEDVESAVAQHFDLPAAEKAKLTLCRELRNKILHCNFSAARGKLGDLGAVTHGGGVKKLSVGGLSATEVAKKLAATDANTPGAFELVASTTAKETGSLFGWLLETGNAGDFQRASEAFKAAATIVDRLHSLGAENAQP